MPQEKPWVTIVTPSYNQGNFIKETIDSVLTQDYPNLEYIVADGGSTDNTIDILKQYTDDRLTWFSEADDGMANGINKGFARGRGEIMTWLNSDDVYIGQPVVESVNYLLQHPNIDIVYGDAVYTDKQGTPTGKWQKGAPFDVVNVASYLNSVPQPGTFWRKRVWDTIGGLREDLHYVLDGEYWLRAYLNDFQLAYMAGDRATYRLHGESKTVTGGLAFGNERERVFNEYLQMPDYRDKLTPHERFVRANIAFVRAKIYRELDDTENARQQAKVALRYAPLHKRSTAFFLLYLDTHLGTDLYSGIQKLWAQLQGKPV